MPTELDHHLAPIRRDGPRRFARWDAALLDAVADGPACALAAALADQPDADAVLAAYLALIQEAIGTGVLRRVAADGDGWTSFLERCLVRSVPDLLPQVRPAERLATLAKVWNLGEGLRREPDWLDRYVTACAGGLNNLDWIDTFLQRVLEPALAPAPASGWGGPFAVTVLDLRPLADEFLPGEMHLAAPAVLCVTDRRHSDIQAGVFLRPGRHSQLLGLTQGLGAYPEPGDPPTVAFDDQRLRVAGKTVELPTLRRCHRHAVARSGFVVASAVDSQRLWVVESG